MPTGAERFLYFLPGGALSDEVVSHVRVEHSKEQPRPALVIGTAKLTPEMHVIKSLPIPQV